MTKEENKKLCEKYPFMRPKFNPYTGKTLERYDYEWTWADDFPKGWYATFGEMMLDELKECLQRADFLEKFTVSQIKEKFGGLRFYHNGVPSSISNEISEIILKYEIISRNVCIECGKPDVRHTTRGWIEPICFECYKRTSLVKHLDPKDQKALYEEETDGSEDQIQEYAKWTLFDLNGKENTKMITFKDTVDRIRTEMGERIRNEQKD